METVRERVPLRVAVLATAAAVALELGAQGVIAATGWEFGSWAELAVELVWMAGLGLITVVGFEHVEGRRPTWGDVGLGVSDVPAAERTDRRRVARWGIVASTVALLALGAVVAGHASGHRADGNELHGISVALVVATIVIRWPVSVLAQQALFFGWLQPRLGGHGLAIAAGLYAVSHLADPAQLLLVAPLGAIFALQRWASGGIVTGVATHYAINVALFTLTLAS